MLIRVAIITSKSNQPFLISSKYSSPPTKSAPAALASSDKLVENFKTVYDLIVKSKPSSSKGVYMKNIVISSTMGPSIKVVTSM